MSIYDNYAIVGAAGDDDNGSEAGAAYIYYFNGTSWEQQAKLTATDGGTGDSFGNSVAIKGGFAIIGAAWADETYMGWDMLNSGAAYVFHYDGSSWIEQHLTHTNLGANAFIGSSVDIESNFAIVGAGGARRAIVYELGNSIWSEHSVLRGPDYNFGGNASIDGNYIVVGSGYYGFSSSPGAAYVYHFDGASWVQQVRLTSSDGATEDAFALASVSVEGNNVIVGAYGDDDSGSESGSAYVFDLATFTNHQPTDIILTPETVPENSGWVDIGTLSTVDPDGQAYVYELVDTTNFQDNQYFEIDGSVLSTVQDFNFESDSSYSIKVSTNDGNGGYLEKVITISVSDVNDAPSITKPGGDFAYSLGDPSVSLAGIVVDDEDVGSIITANLELIDYSNVGIIRSNLGAFESGLWTYSGNVQDVNAALNDLMFVPKTGFEGNATIDISISDGIASPVTESIGLDSVLIASQEIVSTDSAAGDWFGVSVSVDGSFAIVGARGDDGPLGSFTGSAYIFHLDGTGWVQQAQLYALDGGGLFGASVDIEGNHAIVGAPFGTGNAHSSGSAYVYYFDGTSWIQQAKLIASDGEFNDLFGESVSINGDYAVVGARSDDEAASNAGAAYIYHFDGTNWIQQKKLTASDASAEDYFGASVSLDGNNVVVGAYGDAALGWYTGSAYVFNFDGTTWTEQTKLIASDSATGDYFGGSVSIDGNNVVVGAPWDDDHGYTSGSAYIYGYDGNVWTQKSKITAEDGSESSQFGYSVAIVGENLVIGSRFDDLTVANSGAAYVYHFDGNSWIQKFKLAANDGSSYDEFGSSVSLDSNRAIVGAYNSDQNGESSGSVYVFDLGTGNNSTPTEIVLSSHSINENSGIGIAVGTLSTTDQDTGQTFTYTLVDETNYPDNAAFTIEGNVLKTAADFNFEGQNSYTISVQTDDGNGGTFIKEFKINVNNLNEAPLTLDQNVSLDEDTFKEIQLNLTDPENDSLTISLVTQPGNGFLYTEGLNVIYTPFGNYNGTDSFTYMANDGQLQSAETTVNITVNPVNDDPVMPPMVTKYTLEDSGSITFNFGGSYDPDYSNGDHIDHWEFTSVSNDTLFSSPLQGTTTQDPNHTVSLKANANGTSSITVRAYDTHGAYDEASFDVVVRPVNDAPVITLPGSVYSAGAADSVTFSGTSNLVRIDESADNVDPLSTEVGVRLFASHGTLSINQDYVDSLRFGIGDGLNDSEIRFVGYLSDVNHALDGMIFTPDADFTSGLATLNITAGDFGNNGESGLGGVGVSFKNVDIFVNSSPEFTSPNQAPTTTVPGAQTTVVNQAITFSASNPVSNAILMDDPDASDSDVGMFLVARNGSLTLSTTEGLSFGEGDGVNDSSMRFRGSMASINSALDGLIFRPALDFVSIGGQQEALIDIYTSDNAANGWGHSKGDYDRVYVNVTGTLNQAPVNTVPTNQFEWLETDVNTSITFSIAGNNAISVSDPEVGAGNIGVNVMASHGTVTLGSSLGLGYFSGNGTGNLTLMGPLENVNNALNGLRFTPENDYIGWADVMVATSDFGSSGIGGAITDVDKVDIVVGGAIGFPWNHEPAIESPYFVSANDDEPIVFGTATGNIISVSDEQVYVNGELSPDPEADSSIIGIRLSAQNGSLTLGSFEGLTFLSGDGWYDGSVLFKGTVENINAALDGLVFQPDENYSGYTRMDISVNDRGYSGIGGPYTASQTLHMWIYADNDAPVINGPNNQIIDGGQGTLSGITVSDRDVADGDVEVMLGVSSGVLSLPTDNLTLVQGDGYQDSTMTVKGSLEDINDALAGLVYTANQAYSPEDSLVVSVSDLGQEGIYLLAETDTKIIPLTVNPFNRVPTDIGLSEESINENVPVGSVLGALSTADLDTSQTHTYSLVNNDAYPDNAAFTVEGNMLKTAADFNFEHQNSYTINVRTDDGHGGTFEEVFTISVNDVNDYPTDIAISSNSVAENLPVGTLVGDLLTIDEDGGPNYTYSIAGGSTYLDNSKFTISGNQLLTAMKFNFENKSLYQVNVLAEDGNGGAVEKIFDIHVSDANDRPTNILLSTDTINENSGAGALVATLSTVDQDAGQTHSYSLLNTADKNYFTISGNELRTSADFDFETDNSYTIKIKTTDQEGATYNKEFEIKVADANDNPTGISLDNSNVDENLPVGSVVGTLSTVDQDGGQSYVYSLINDPVNFPDNALFTIDGLILKTNAVFDHETTDQFRIAIQTDDNHGGSFVQQLYININDTNDIPAEIRLSSNLIDENLGSNAVVGTLSTEDQDVGQTFSYELVSGNGDNDNASFRIEGDILKTVDNLDYETRNLYSIRLQTDDGNGGSLERVFTIAVADGNDLPTGINLNTTTIPENSGTGAVIGIFSSDDQDTAQNHVYSLVSGLGDDDNSSFEINGLQLKARENFNYEIQASHSIRVQTDDGHGGFFEKVFIISVEDVNDTPSDISLTSNTVSENMPVGTIIGTLGVSDEAEGQSYGYTLTDSANFTDNQFFEIVGDQLVTKASFNFEARESYQIKVQVNDGNTGGTFDKELEIFVQDANDTPTNITLSSYSIQENSGVGAMVGKLQTSDEDAAQTHSYSLVNGGAYPDNLKFLIVGDELRTASDFDHEIKDSYLIRVKSNDGNGGSVTRNLTISVADINEAPTVNAPPSASYLEDAAILAIPGIVVNDQDEGAIVTATLTLGDHENAGVINSAHVASNSEGVWQFSGAVDAVNAELASLAFRPNHNYDVNTSINVLISDGELSESRNISLDVTPSSDKSTLNISDTSFVFVVGDNTPINVGAGSNIIVDDPDTGDTLTVKLTWNKQTGSVVYDGGTDNDGLLEFTGDESTVNALLESVAFSPKDGLSKDTSLTVAVKDTDGISFDSTKTISLKKNFPTSVQTWDASISQWVSFNQGAPYIRDYVEGYDKVFLPSIRIIDGDSNETVTVTLKLDDVSTGYLTSKTNYTKDTIYNESTGVWTYTGKVSNVNTMLGKVVFVPGDDTDINSSISVRISDGDSDPIEGTIILDVTPRNDIPVFVSLPETEDGVIRYDENSASVSLAGISIADPDTAENDITVTVKVYEPDTGALNLASAAEPGAVVADYQVVDGIGVWSVTGTVEQVNKTLDRLLFIPQTDNDSSSSLSIEVTDHEYDYTVKEYLNLEVIPAEGVNDPVEASFIISGQLKPITFEPTVQYKEGYDNVYLPTIVVSDDDPDDVFNALFTLQNTDTRVTIEPGAVKDVIGHIETYYNAQPLVYKGAGVWALENVNMSDLNYALNHLRFQPTDYNDHDARLDVLIQDDAETSVSASVTLKVISRNSQASFTDTPDSVINYDEDSAPFVLKTTQNGTDHFLRVDDPDTGEKVTATVTLSDTSVGSMTSTYSFGGATQTISGSTSGIWAIKNKSVEEVNLALENLKFAPKANNEKDAWFSVEVKDGGENATVNLYREFDLKVNPKNDQVKVSGDTGVAVATAVKYQGDMKLKTQLDLPDIKVVDIDTKEKVKATFTLNVDPSMASLSRFATPDNSAYKVTGGVGTWTFEDTVDNLNTAIKDLKFIPQDDFRETFTGTTSISVKIMDGLENGASAKNGSIFIDYGTKTSWWDLLE